MALGALSSFLFAGIQTLFHLHFRISLAWTMSKLKVLFYSTHIVARLPWMGVLVILLVCELWLYMDRRMLLLVRPCAALG